MTPAARPQLVHTPLVTHNLSPHNLSTTRVKLCLVERCVSMVEGACFCMRMDCGCAEVFNHEKSYPDVFISAFETFSAGLRQFGGCIDLFWAICCRMARSNLNSM